MNEENYNADCTPETFVAYNEAIGLLKATNAQYIEDTKEMCELTVFSLLNKIYYIKDVYSKVLEFMQKEGLYERYARAIFELQLNPPPPPQGQEGNSGESQGQSEGQSESQNSNEENNAQNNQNKPESGGGVATEQHRSNGITRDFLNRLFDDDNNL